MSTLLRGAFVVDLEPAVVERADLRIEGNQIIARATALEPLEGEEIIELPGRYLFPGLVSAWHRFGADFLRGAPRIGKGFGGEQQTRQRIEDAMTGDQLVAAVASAAVEALRSGTTTLLGVTGSGPLARVATSLEQLGVRAVVGRLVSERRGAMVREESLEENAAFAARAKGRVRGAFAAESLGAMSDEGLAGLKEARKKNDSMLLACLSEDPEEEKESREKYGAGVAERLVSHELTGTRVVLAHGVHLAWPELSQLIANGTWLAHAARSNMATQTGHATPAKFGVHACLGTDIATPDLFSEAHGADLRTTDSGQPIDVLRFLANGHRLATEAFGMTVGPLSVGSAADVLVLDYQPSSPFDASTLSAHVRLGLSSRAVESVMVDGLWRVWRRKVLSADAAEVARTAREAAQDLWRTLQS